MKIIVFTLTLFISYNNYAQEESQTNISIAFRYIRDIEDLENKQYKTETENERLNGLYKQFRLKYRDAQQDKAALCVNLQVAKDSIGVLKSYLHTADATKKKEIQKLLDEMNLQQKSFEIDYEELKKEFEKMQKQAELKTARYEEEIEKMRDEQINTRHEILKRCNRIYFDGVNPLTVKIPVKCPKHVSFDLYYYPLFDELLETNVETVISLRKKGICDEDLPYSSWDSILSRGKAKSGSSFFFYESDKKEEKEVKPLESDCEYYYTIKVKKVQEINGRPTNTDVEIMRSDYFKVREK